MNKDLIRSVKFTLFWRYPDWILFAAQRAAAFGLLGQLSDCADPFGALEFYAQPAVYFPIREQCAGCDAEGRRVLSGFYAGLDVIGKLADDRPRLE